MPFFFNLDMHANLASLKVIGLEPRVKSYSYVKSPSESNLLVDSLISWNLHKMEMLAKYHVKSLTRIESLVNSRVGPQK